MKKIYFKKLNKDAVLPTYANKGDAGMDLYSTEDITIPSKSWGLVHTGLSLELPENTEAQVRSRSGLALKNGVFVLNSPGTIDQGYRGEIGVILCNLSEQDFAVKKGDRIAQLVVLDLCQTEILEATSLSKTSRGTGGFGSSGV